MWRRVTHMKRACRWSQTALEYVRDNGMRAKLSCSYLSETFLPRHPHFRDLTIQ